MIETRLTRAFDLRHPIVSAPMARAAGGKLAAAVTRAGALGMIGGGYCDAEWIETEFAQAGNAHVGCGLITWRLAQDPGVLDHVLSHQPRALFLSFDDPKPFAPAIHAAGVPLICQVQTLAGAHQALEAGAAVIVAQGGEAGGHGGTRGTLAFVPEVVDLLAAQSPETLLLAAGGISDGRGLAAALMLGADGVLMGTRFWASAEALVHRNQIAAALAATGDATIKTKTVDIARGFEWPEDTDLRVLRNDFTDRWQTDLTGLRAAGEAEAARWVDAWVNGDVGTGNAIAGEAVGLIRSAPSADQIITATVKQAKTLLDKGW